MSDDHELAVGDPIVTVDSGPYGIRRSVNGDMTVPPPPKVAIKEQVDDALLRGVERTFGKITVDLAATDEDHKAPRWITPERDTFTVNWAEEIGDGLGWLNPPFDVELMPWIQKCSIEAKRGARLLVITPAIVDEFWFWEYLVPQATNYVLYPRKLYQGLAVPLILSAFNVGPHPADERLHLWNWTTGVIR